MEFTDSDILLYVCPFWDARTFGTICQINKAMRGFCFTIPLYTDILSVNRVERFTAHEFPVTSILLNCCNMFTAGTEKNLYNMVFFLFFLVGQYSIYYLP